MSYSVIKGAGYILVHVPGMVMHHGTTQTTEKVVNPGSDYLKELPSHMRSYEDCLAYPPNQTYIGNLPIDDLAEIPEPWADKKVEKPYRQLEALLDAGGALRRQSVGYKGGADFLGLLERYARDFAAYGPDFRDVRMDRQVLIRRDELTRMYRNELYLLSPAQKLQRMLRVVGQAFQFVPALFRTGKFY